MPTISQFSRTLSSIAIGGLTDSDGDDLDGGKSYRVHIPANVPAANYWSYVLYDSETRALLDNGQLFPSIASNTNLKLNPGRLGY